VAEPDRGGRRVGRPERPQDPPDGPVSRFAHELRQLRAAAGYPTYRALARRAMYSASVLSSAAGGASFPTLQVTLAFARACGADPAEWQRRWEAAAVGQ
jgi:transcriptional regulator with XRE-family HTH domain